MEVGVTDEQFEKMASIIDYHCRNVFLKSSGITIGQ